MHWIHAVSLFVLFNVFSPLYAADETQFTTSPKGEYRAEIVTKDGNTCVHIEIFVEGSWKTLYFIDNSDFSPEINLNWSDANIWHQCKTLSVRTANRVYEYPLGVSSPEAFYRVSLTPFMEDYGDLQGDFKDTFLFYRFEEFSVFDYCWNLLSFRFASKMPVNQLSLFVKEEDRALWFRTNEESSSRMNLVLRPDHILSQQERILGLSQRPTLLILGAADESSAFAWMPMDVVGVLVQYLLFLSNPRFR